MAPSFRGKLEIIEKEVIGKNALITSLLATNKVLQDSLKAIYTGVHMSVVGLDALVGISSTDDPSIEGLLSPSEINTANHGLLTDMSLQGVCLLYKKIKDANEVLRETEISLAKLGPLASSQPEASWDDVPSPITRSLDLATRTLEALQRESLDKEEGRYTTALNDAGTMIDIALGGVTQPTSLIPSASPCQQELGSAVPSESDLNEPTIPETSPLATPKTRGPHQSPKAAKIPVSKMSKWKKTDHK